MSQEAVLNELKSQLGNLIHQSDWIEITQEKICLLYTSPSPRD